MADDTYKPLGGHPPPPAGISSNIFRSIALRGDLVGDIAVLSDGTFYEWDGNNWNSIAISGGSGAKQVFSGNYGGGTPTDTPTATSALAIDTSNKTLWQWYDAAWH